ncbi:MAG: hypothetical protein H7X92_09935 [Chitinophagales bacterium]|nr:hypothetical protein [Hyphomicrobiales bacterium]
MFTGLPASGQNDGRRGFCVDYANEAVEMQRRNIRLGCGIQGARWHEWWDDHYGWCKDWVGPNHVREHAELRRIELSRCDNRDDGGRERRSEHEQSGRY